MKPQLISFKLCPFVQKAVLVLLYKQIEFDIEYIDLEDPPAWFTQVSPLGKVPVLKTGDEILFESSVIIEYLDEVYGEPLHPIDPLQKAQNRSWIEFGNECLFNSHQMIMAADKAGYDEQRNALRNKLDHLENQLTGAAYFNGSEVSLVDLSFAPFFQRQSFIAGKIPALIDPSRHQKLANWSENLLKLPQIPASTVPDIRRLYLDMVSSRGGYINLNP